MSLSSHITKVNKVSLSDNFCISYKLLKSFSFSAKKEKSSRSLNKLTNEKLDNQSVNFPKNKEQEQEKKKDDGRKKEIKSPPSPVILFGRLFNFVAVAVVFFRVLPAHVAGADLFSVSFACIILYICIGRNRKNTYENLLRPYCRTISAILGAKMAEIALQNG